MEGARQVGKTFIIKKFARENYKNFLYVNLVEKSGYDFLTCLEKAREWEPGSVKRPVKPLHEAFKMYSDDFVDDEETVVVVDEIHEDAKAYNCIRQFAREFSCHFVVAGSYPGKTFNRAYFHPVGDVDVVRMETLGFDEFLDAFGKRDLYEGTDLYGRSNHRSYVELKGYYDAYSQTGGYPSVVNAYLKTGDLKACEGELRKVIHIFMRESKAYFTNASEHAVLEGTLSAVARWMAGGKGNAKD